MRPSSWLFAAATALRRAAFRAGWLRSTRIALPVVVVGNISAGGTGKTPLVIWLARELTARGVRVGIISRGYGAATPSGSRRDPYMRVTANTAAAQCGDEPALIARATGLAVIVSRNRVAAAQALAGEAIDLILADDGLQHYALARDVEIAVVDAQRRFGNARLLPAGPLREAPSRLRTVQAVVFHGDPADPGDGYVMRLLPGRPRRLSDGKTCALADFQRTGTVHAVAGIGNPQRFFASLRAAGLDIIEHAFADHHAFRSRDFAFADNYPVLMTPKDAVKCGDIADARLWELPVDAALAPHDAQRLLALVCQLVAGAKPPLPTRSS